MPAGVYKKIVRVAVGLISDFAFRRNDKSMAVEHQPTSFNRCDTTAQQLFTETSALRIGRPWKTGFQRCINWKAFGMVQENRKQTANEHCCMSSLFLLHGRCYGAAVTLKINNLARRNNHLYFFVYPGKTKKLLRSSRGSRSIRLFEIACN